MGNSSACSRPLTCAARSSSPTCFGARSDASPVVVVHPNGFGVDLDLDALADEEASGLERLVPREVEVLAIDVGARKEPGSQLPPRVRAHAAELHRQEHLAGDVADLEHAGDIPLVGLPGTHRGAPEFDLGIMLDIEEV